MHSYQHNIKTFNNATRHLTRVERSLYRDLIELYYDTESALTADIKKLQRLVIAQNDEEKEALNYVLEEFFELTGEVYTHTFCDEVIEAYKNNTSAKAAAGKASAAARKKKAEELKAARAKQDEQNSTPVQQPLDECSTNQKPETRNHKPIIDMCFSLFWEAGMVKQNKKAALKKFTSILQKQSDPEQFTQRLVADVKTRLERNQIGFAELHPTTYLNNERWEDDLPKQQGANYAANQSGNQKGRISSMEATLRHNAEYAAQLEREIEQEALASYDQSLAVPQR